MDEATDKPLVCDYLKTKTLAQLEADHGVKSRVAGHKVSLNYSQLEAVDADPVSQQCRGLILRRVDGATIDPDLPLGETVVLARPFDRFFNLGQAGAADVDFDSPDTRFFEKLDGTMCVLYFDDIVEEWHVATRSVPEANLFIDGFESFTFRTLFERAVADTVDEFNKFVELLPCKGTTYVFELTTPVNRIVVPYESYGVTLLGARFNEDGLELDPVPLSKALGVPHAPIYRLGSVTEMVEFVSGRDPQGYEGIVVCDPQYRRVKVKSAGYLALNRIQDSVTKSPRALLELVLLEKIDDVVSLVPEFFIKRAYAMQDGLRTKIRTHDAFFTECIAVADTIADRDVDERAHRKAFAVTVSERGGWMAPLMEQYTGRCSGLRDWIDRRRQVDGGWSNSFLDCVMKAIE